MSNLRSILLCMDKRYIVLGVALDWGKRKGLDVFIQLDNRLPSDYQIVLVGTNERIDADLPQSIITVHRTKSKEELAQWYSASDVLVNPTREDTFPTVNIEALACGTPVATYRTGGSPEIIDSQTGIVVDCEDIDALVNAIQSLCCKEIRKECVERASHFSESEKFQEYMSLY